MKQTKTEVLTLAVLSAVVLFLTSCATTSSQIAFHEEVIAEDQTDAIVYIYRLSNIMGAAGSWSIKLDGKEVALLKQKAYAVLRATPGEHVITVGETGTLPSAIVEASTKKLRTFTAVSKGVYFFRCKGAALHFVTREKALTEIVETKYDMGL